MIRQCPHCHADLGPFESRDGCLTCQGVRVSRISDRAVQLLEAADQALPYWDIARLLRAGGHEVWKPSLTATLGTDRRFCWAGRGIYGLFRHGFPPGARELAGVGGLYLHAADRVLSLSELDFILKFVGYRYQEVSLRNALWRGLYLRLYKNDFGDTWCGSPRAESRQRTAAGIMGLKRGPAFRAVIDRLANQVELALDERSRRIS